MLLKRLFGSEDDLRNIIYASNLMTKDDSSKRLRIATQGEGLFSTIQQSFELLFPLKSFFLVAQLYEDYVQLTLNQVVTEAGLDHEDQEAIIVRDQTFAISNIYESLCFNMWNNIAEDNSLIHLCDAHKWCKDDELLEMFSLENQSKFMSNLTEYISNNILHKNVTTEKTDTATIYLSNSCGCRVCLTVNDITEISFRPVLQDIISLVSTSLINSQFFGNYGDIQFMFHLIDFNHNPQFQDILIKIIDDETDYFLYDRKTSMPQYTIRKLSNQLLQPILQQKSCFYDAFRKGVLYHVHSENYGFHLSGKPDDLHLNFKNEISDAKSVSIREKTVLPLFKKGSKINNSQTNRVFYLNQSEFSFTNSLCITLSTKRRIF
ncbi:hypothetical protein EDC94DRAFT_281683 [Helicostylum pulchrum]|nr:hypothetical protein EDC94DRAFT_281683 [Helicostylum pulchrum]